ncbi:amino acid adenylation domain protein (plasmid) [Gemmatirosa kalamazoonensis]|uniref:Amino acid adenylation domain protein n=1 Tax=Gemmatirosa kalamazoonensis TaxID=861299 RepID=W0RSC1_9BACT|nr:non-ribosomal peptide synthetase [Gemmatirosa kalamazoonensis]AHG93601.1 amino acid adenylation domain protein [Gemmatirosa kalamazoonensis]
MRSLPTASYPLASLQAAMLVNHLRTPRGTGVDVVQMVATLPEAIDPARMRAAWATVTARHDALRTAFRWEGVVEPVQEVHAEAPPPVTELDWSDVPAAAVPERIRAYLAEDRRVGFDLREPPLQRVVLVRLADDDWRMMWTFHHILMDGRSFAIVLRELFAVYEAATPAAARLPERRAYRDFVAWYGAKDFDAAEPYWRERMAGLRRPTPIPAGFRAPNEQAGGRGLHQRMLDAAPTAALERMAREHGLTMNTVVQGAWALMLAYHAGEPDVVFGATRACRKGTIDGADDIVGLFINTLPVRARVRPDVSLVDWLAELRETWRSMFAVEHTPLRLVHRWSEVPTDTPLFDTQVVFENLPLGPTMRTLGGGMAERDFELFGGTNFALTGLLYGGTELRLEIENARDVVDDATAARLLDHLATLLEAMAANPRALLGDLSPLPESERRLVVEEWNDTARSLGSEDATLVSLLAEQAARTPDAVAVVDERASLTYAQLDARAAALARRLRALGVGAGALVAVCAERSVELVVALVAVGKAGGAYVPVDPEYPAERVAYMLADSGAPVLLTTAALARTLPAHQATLVLLDGAAEDADRADVADHADDVVPLPRPAADDVAYMIYTSGSTGRPKGALNAQRGIVNRLRWMQAEYALGAGDVVLQKTPFSFDVSVWEFFWPLMSGAKLVLARPGGHRDAAYLAATIQRHGVTVCHFVPSMLRAFLAEPTAAGCASLRDVMASGEALGPDLVAGFYRALPGSRLHNLYGPTECAVDVTYWPCPPSPEPPAVVPIGRPVANTRVYVLDAERRPVPIGVAGELYLGGVQVGMGYHNRPDLTAERFVPDPFGTRDSGRGTRGGEAPESRVPSPESRLYRTGDLARWRPDGTVEYLGRLDFQVKIRGFRIELGEIEATLLAHAGVRDAVVVARGAGNEQRLVAFLVAAREPLSAGALREHLLATLPEYMVPAVFAWLPALPLSSNGKVDRRALPDAEGVGRAALSGRYVAPRTDAERTLAEIWAQVLRVERVGVDDNFFELGGDSLLSVQIVARAALAGLKLSLTQVLRHPTVASLAHVAQTTTANAVAHAEIVGEVPLTPVQHWFFEGQREQLHHWNQAFLFTAPAELDDAVLADAVDAVTRHHDSLRLRFERTPNGWRARCAADAPAAHIEVVELGHLPETSQHAAITEASVRVQGTLDLARGPLLRAALFRLGADRPARLLVAVHHLAIDGVSWRVLREDLETAYTQRAAGSPIALPARTTPFGAWATRLNDASVRDTLRNELAYWEAVGSPASVRLPRDLAASGEDFAAYTDTVVVRLGEDETRALLQAVPAAYNTQINDALLAALAESFGGWVGPSGGDIVVNLEGHGREALVDGADLSRTLGWFTTIFPVRLPLGAADLGARLRETKERLRAVPGRGVGYGVLRYLGDGAETLRAQTTPDVVFNYMGQFDQVVAGSTLFAHAPESTGSWYGPRTVRRHLLEINALVIDGRLEIRWSYSERTHRRETIAGMADAYVAALRALVAHCTAPGVGGYTPSDFPLARLDQAAVDRLTNGAAGARDVEDVYPLVPMQRLFLGYAHSAGDPGFEQWRYRLRGPLDATALHAAWDLVTARHAIFRTAFAVDGVSEPVQVVRRRAELPWAEHDLRGLTEQEQTRRLHELLEADRAAGFALDRAPLMRLMLVRLADDEYELVWSNHHLLLDRWSWPLVLLEISRAYPALVRGERPALDRAARYADFVAWQQERPLDEARRFWARHFDGFAPPPRLPLLPLRGDVDASEPAEVSATLTAEETREVHALARASRVAANTLVAAAWALWLARRSGHDDVSFGVTVAGRDAGVPDVERLVGLTINNLPLRARVAPGESLGAWLATVHEGLAEMQSFAHTPLERVQEWSGVPWRARLFETLLVFQHDDAEELTRSWLGDAVRTELVHVPTRTAYPLSVIVAGSDALDLRVTYDARYFDDASAREMAEGLRHALLAMVSAPGATVDALRAALPAPAAAAHEHGVGGARAYVEPRTATEAVVAALWGEVLGVERVGAEDDFFALGGYSLVATQIVSRVRSTLQVEAPVRLLFQHPTVAAFAAALTARERKPGQLERVAQVVRRVLAMTPDELRRAGASRVAST